MSDLSKELLSAFQRADEARIHDTDARKNNMEMKIVATFKENTIRIVQIAAQSFLVDMYDPEVGEYCEVLSEGKYSNFSTLEKALAFAKTFISGASKLFQLQAYISAFQHGYEARIHDTDVKKNDMNDCLTLGCCTCPNMQHCPSCGYTEHDKQYWLDHHLCEHQTIEHTAEGDSNE
jgi:hypothetical protein